MTATINKILVPIDFSDGSMAAFRLAVEFRDKFQAKLHVLHVWAAPVYAGTESVVVHVPEGSPMTLAEYVRSQAEAQTKLFLKEQLDSYGVGSIESKVVSGDPVEMILKEAEGHDMIVLGTHGRRGLAHLLIGSVAERVLRKAKCPVVTVRASEPQKV